MAYIYPSRKRVKESYEEIKRFKESVFRLESGLRKKEDYRRIENLALQLYRTSNSLKILSKEEKDSIKMLFEEIREEKNNFETSKEEHSFWNNLVDYVAAWGGWGFLNLVALFASEEIGPYIHYFILGTLSLPLSFHAYHYLAKCWSKRRYKKKVRENSEKLVEVSRLILNKL